MGQAVLRVIVVLLVLMEERVPVTLPRPPPGPPDRLTGWWGQRTGCGKGEADDRPEGIEQRVSRIEELMVGLGKELALCRGKQTPLLDTERKEYLNRVMDAIDGLDEARVPLLGALERMQKEESLHRVARA